MSTGLYCIVFRAVPFLGDAPVESSEDEKGDVERRIIASRITASHNTSSSTATATVAQSATVSTKYRF